MTRGFFVILLSFLLTGCITSVGKEGFNAEWGGSSSKDVAERHIERVTYELVDGHFVVTEFNVVERGVSEAKNDGIGDNMKSLLTVPLGIAGKLVNP